MGVQVGEERGGNFNTASNLFVASLRCECWNPIWEYGHHILVRCTRSAAYRPGLSHQKSGSSCLHSLVRRRLDPYCFFVHMQFPAIKLESLVSSHDIAPQDGILKFLVQAMLMQSSGSCLSSQFRQLRGYQCYEKQIQEYVGIGEHWDSKTPLRIF